MHRSPSSEKPSGKTHLALPRSKTYTDKSSSKFVGILNRDGKVLELQGSYTNQTQHLGVYMWDTDIWKKSSLFSYQMQEATIAASKGKDVMFFRTIDRTRFHFSFSPIHDRQQHCIAILVEVMPSKESHAETLKPYSAIYMDPLTQLPNRLSFNTSLEKQIESAQKTSTPFGLILLDIDRFNLVNDGLGHLFGDLLIREIANRFQEVMQDNDILARIDGDEFAILLRNTAHDHASLRTSIIKFQDCLLKPFHIMDHRLHVTCSIGASMFPMHADTPASMTKHADIAMQQAKKSGKNRYRIYTPQMSKLPLIFLTMENDMRRGLEKGEFVMYLQPQVDIIEKKLVGAEALIRWQHPVHGLLLPPSFLPIARETDIGIQIDQWVLKEVARLQETWAREGIDIETAVNVSSTLFQSRDFIPLVSEIRKQGTHLAIEITEHTIMENTAKTEYLLNQVKQMDIPLCLDDFGTGYSSLSCLQTFPLDKIKVDRAFIRLIGKDTSAHLIIRSIIELAKALNLDIIAEGVETLDQLKFMTQSGSRYIQGFLMSKPLPPDVFVDYVKKNSPNCQLDVTL